MSDRGLQSISTGTAVARTFEPEGRLWVVGAVPLPVRYDWVREVESDDPDPHTQEPQMSDLVSSSARGGRIGVYATQPVTITVWTKNGSDWVKAGSRDVGSFEEAFFDTGYRIVFVQVTGVSQVTKVHVAVIG